MNWPQNCLQLSCLHSFQSVSNQALISFGKCWARFSHCPLFQKSFSYRCCSFCYILVLPFGLGQLSAAFLHSPNLMYGIYIYHCVLVCSSTFIRPYIGQYVFLKHFGSTMSPILHYRAKVRPEHENAPLGSLRFRPPHGDRERDAEVTVPSSFSASR